MSRIGKMPIAIPKGVTVTAEGTTVTVKGTRGELRKTFHPDLAITVENGNVVVARPSDDSRRATPWNFRSARTAATAGPSIS